jgi:tRNA (guanine37-N1)-methyltransferase
MLCRAAEFGLVGFGIHNIRDFSVDKHHTTDDRPFGGGPGMVMKPEPVCSAIDSLKTENSTMIYMCPDGKPLTTELIIELAKKKHLILLSGHYEGIDERIRESRVDLEISIGDYVITNGTLAAAVLADAVCRYVPGVLGNADSLNQDSFSNGLLSFPQYTRPVEFEGKRVPNVLISGNHAEINKWRLEKMIEKTKERRSDIFQKWLNLNEKHIDRYLGL